MSGPGRAPTLLGVPWPQMIDLHTHSDVSDGSDPPARIPELAAEAGCSAVALTDHDSLAGVGPARRRAEELGITFVPGCEVSCQPVGPGGMHVLVYFVEDDESPLGVELVRLRADRRRRNLALADRLISMGVPITYEMVVAQARSEAGVGRPHFAAAMVAVGAAASVDDAFEHTLANQRPGFVRKGAALRRRCGPPGQGVGRRGGARPSLQPRPRGTRPWPGRWESWRRPGSAASKPSTVGTLPGNASSSETWPAGSTW